MSGQAGLYDFDRRPVEDGLADTLTTDLDDYGPDGKGTYTEPGVVMIHRAAHFDSLSEAEHQPHVSADGDHVVYLSYGKDVTGHPANKDGAWYVMTLAYRQINVLARLFGGQGTINVPSWSADSRKLTFVSYQMGP